ncbi:hypothetical protein IG631_14693 [Alternaria alternata]|nr:hypothetical protein IG631_14693 [Alternaria alternata]
MVAMTSHSSGGADSYLPNVYKCTRKSPRDSNILHHPDTNQLFSCSNVWMRQHSYNDYNNRSPSRSHNLHPASGKFAYQDKPENRDQCQP